MIYLKNKMYRVLENMDIKFKTNLHHKQIINVLKTHLEQKNIREKIWLYKKGKAPGGRNEKEIIQLKNNKVANKSTKYYIKEPFQVACQPAEL